MLSDLRMLGFEDKKDSYGNVGPGFLTGAEFFYSFLSFFLGGGLYFCRCSSFLSISYSPLFFRALSLSLSLSIYLSLSRWLCLWLCLSAVFLR